MKGLLVYSGLMVPGLLTYYILYNSKYIHKVKDLHTGETLGDPRRREGLHSVAMFTLQAKRAMTSQSLSLTHFRQC